MDTRRIAPTRDFKLDGSDLPNHPCFSKPKKCTHEEQDTLHSAKPELTAFDKVMLNANRGVADGTEFVRKHATPTTKHRLEIIKPFTGRSVTT